MSMGDLFGHFPGRPQHPDFAVLSDVVLQHEGNQEDAGFEMGAYIGRFIDEPSLVYMAKQRAARFLALHGKDPTRNAQLVSMIAAAYLDGFITGNLYHERKTEGDST